MVAEDGKRRNMVSLPASKTCRLVTNHQSQQSKTRNPRQGNPVSEECDDVLYEYWTKGFVVNPRRMSVMEELNQALR